jgi:hypothetical protein
MINTFRFEFIGDLQVGAFSYSARREEWWLPTARGYWQICLH